MKQYDVLNNVLDDDRATYLQEILKMSTSIFMCLSAEWSSLHHADEAWLGAENSRRVLSAIASKTYVELPRDWFDCD